MRREQDFDGWISPHWILPSRIPPPIGYSLSNENLLLKEKETATKFPKFDHRLLPLRNSYSIVLFFREIFRHRLNPLFNHSQFLAVRWDLNSYILDEVIHWVFLLHQRFSLCPLPFFICKTSALLHHSLLHQCGYQPAYHLLFILLDCMIF